MSWKQRTCIVVGATAGLARETLGWLAQEGAPLVLHGRKQTDLDELAKRLKDQAGSALSVATVAGDVTDPELGPRLWDAAAALPGTPYGFLCFVGIPGRLAPDQWTPAALADIFAVNCAGPLLLCRSWCQAMKAQELEGNAVLFSTMQANYPFVGSMPYSLGKVALQQGVSLLAKEFGGPPTLRINAIAPGVNEAGMALASIQRGKYQPYVDEGKIPRYGNPTDIQQAVAFLLQPSLYMAGQTLLLDGGLTLRKDQG